MFIICIDAFVNTLCVRVCECVNTKNTTFDFVCLVPIITFSFV